MRRLLTPLAAVGLLAAPPPGTEAPMAEYAVKAQILVELLSYVHWPAAGEGTPWPFEIVVVGRSPFGRHLDDYVRTRTIRRRPIRVRYQARVADVGTCDAIFLCRSEAARAEAVSAWARGHQILTVCDEEGLARRGLMITLVTEGNFVRLVVNPGAASAAGIAFSSLLLQNARVVSTARPAGGPG